MTELDLLRRTPEWQKATDRLRTLRDKYEGEATERATETAAKYVGRRGAMIFDVVASRQRNYEKNVLNMVDRWETDHGSSLASLAEAMPDRARYGLKASEPGTMQAIAQNLLQIGQDWDSSEDETCVRWAEDVQEFELAPKLDPTVGGVSGIGPALFAYLRMLCGADALKADSRVASSLRALGFRVPDNNVHARMIVARCAASELGLSLLVLDQLLWFWGERIRTVQD